MKIIFEWQEGRETRRTESELPKQYSYEELKEYTISALNKAIKYSNDPLPEGIKSEGDL